MLIPKLLRKTLPLALINRPFSGKVYEISVKLFDANPSNSYYRLVPVSHEEATRLLEQQKVIVMKKTERASSSCYDDDIDKKKDDGYYYCDDDYDDDYGDFITVDTARRRKNPKLSKETVAEPSDEAAVSEVKEQIEKDRDADKTLSLSDLAFLEAGRRFDRLMAAEEATFFSGLNEERAAYSTSASDGNIDAEFEAIQERSRILFESQAEADREFISKVWDSPGSSSSSWGNTGSSCDYGDSDCGGGGASYD